MMIDERKVYLSRKEIEKGQFYFVLPEGWNEAELELHWGEDQRSRPATPIIEVSQPSTSVPDLAHLTITDNLAESVYKRCRKYLYFSKLVGFEDHGLFSTPLYDQGEDSKFMITAFTNEHAATSLHSLRKLVDKPNVRDAEVEDEFNIYSCENPELPFNVTIVKILPTSDCAILKSMSGPFPHHPVIHLPETGMRAVCLGYPSFEDVKAEGILAENQVHEKEPVPFPVEICALNVPRPNMFAASCDLAHGFSGGGLFRVYGKSDFLLGICNRGRIPPKEWLDKWAQEKWLHRRSVSYYTSSSAILFLIDDMEKPATKKLKTSS
uniref:Uncharacterized protein n=1 Tax=Acrobeloides nanus TaxID=290746 RepID=A0A914CUI2_9BILA